MDSVIIDPPADSLGTLVFLHGLGASGHDFEPVARQLMPVLPLRWVLPHAGMLPVTLNGGYRMPAWYDMLSMENPNAVDWDTVAESRDAIHELLKQEAAKEPQKLLLGGFSQGGAISLRSGFDSPVKLDGIVALSTYLLEPRPGKGLPQQFDGEAAPPVFQGHGTFDNVLPLELGEMTRDKLTAAGVKLEWHSYPMPHSVCPREIEDLLNWLQFVLQ